MSEYRDVTTGRNQVSMAIRAKDAAKILPALIEHATDEQRPIEITSKRGNAMLVPTAQWESIQNDIRELREKLLRAESTRLRLDPGDQAEAGRAQDLLADLVLPVD